MSIFTDVLIKGSEELGTYLSSDAVNIYEKYRLFLYEKNAILNLTSIEGERECAERHFLDSLAVLLFTDLKNADIIDVGSGAGFPGLPLKIAEPSAKLTMLDSIGKKVDFLSELCTYIGVEAACVQGRAEELSLRPIYRSSFDICVSRALARLNVLAELCLPFVRTGGLMAAMKARDYGEELSEAENAVRILGGTVERVCDYIVGSVPRSIILIRKTYETPPDYPRRFSRIQKKPL